MNRWLIKNACSQKGNDSFQRENLNSIEIAISYKKLIDELKLNQEKLGKRVGKDRSTISNYIRLLKLDPIIQSGIRDNFISMGHGRCLINIESKDQQILIYEKILRNSLSVRQTEKIVKELSGKKIKKTGFTDEKLIKKIKILEKKFSLGIDLKLNKDKGLLSFKFNNKEELDELIKKLND